jgi:hypothetical protein
MHKTIRPGEDPIGKNFLSKKNNRNSYQGIILSTSVLLRSKHEYSLVIVTYGIPNSDKHRLSSVERRTYFRSLILPIIRSVVVRTSRRS